MAHHSQADEVNLWSSFDANTPNPGAGGRLGALVFAGSGPGRTGRHALADGFYLGAAPPLALIPQRAFQWETPRSAAFPAGTSSSSARLAHATPGEPGPVRVSSQIAGRRRSRALEPGWKREDHRGRCRRSLAPGRTALPIISDGSPDVAVVAGKLAIHQPKEIEIYYARRQ